MYVFCLAHALRTTLGVNVTTYGTYGKPDDHAQLRTSVAEASE